MILIYFANYYLTIIVISEDFERLYESFHELYEPEKTWYFDEIQNIEGWERFVRRLHNEGQKVYITGSNARMLSMELGTHLTGRFNQSELFPFSFTENGKVTKAIQVCKTLENQGTRQREMNGLTEAMRTHQLTEGFIITEDEEDQIHEDGSTIQVLPVWKWLLGSEGGNQD
nr:AAA family ATPase [Bacteroidota bacterium]